MPETEPSPDQDRVLAQPPDVAGWTENLLFALSDPRLGVGMWLHLGTVPTDWEVWEDRVLLSLPDQRGVLTLWSYHRSDPGRRPGGANLGFEMVEPFRRWRVTFDGLGLVTPHEELRTGLVHDGEKLPVRLELEVEMLSPPWDAHAASQRETGRGSMETQEWATEHYEQLCRATGTVVLPSGRLDFDGSGWRDHSRGPRGTGVGSGWGGHMIMGAWFPGSQRGLGLSRYWKPDGEATLEGGYVVEDGRLRHVAVVEVPELASLTTAGEALRFGVRDGGEGVSVSATTTTSMWAMMSRGMPYGVDPASSAPVYAINFADCEWDGETGHLYVERSAILA